MSENSNWVTLPNSELITFLHNKWNLKGSQLNYLTMMGRFVKTPAVAGFTDIRDSEFGKLRYPPSQFQEEIFISFKLPEDSDLISDQYYKFDVYLKSPDKREFKEKIYLFYPSYKTIQILTPVGFVERRKRLYTGLNNELARTIKNSLRILTSEINRQPETFVYELLQNADDYKDPNAASVAVKFTLTENFLIITHNGKPFDFQNVYALTGISQGDKRENKEAIGFKGIGFKSIFKNSNYVSIKSGPFNFCFSKAEFTNPEMPWQVIPVWVNEPAEELTNNTDYQHSNVSIAIAVKKNAPDGIEQAESYKTILGNIFRDDRILIFLRNVNLVRFHDLLEDTELEIQKSRQKWLTSGILFRFVVDPEIRDWLNKQIKDDDITIPEKYQNINSTLITFATEKDSKKIIGTTDSKVYNYLPTELDFGFSFLINGDFIPDGSRTEILDNEWNKYLAEITGFRFIEWLAQLGNFTLSGLKQPHYDRSYIQILPDFKNSEKKANGKSLFFIDCFKKGFKDAIISDNAIAFLPAISGRLVTLSEIVVDETGILIQLGPSFSLAAGITNQLLDPRAGTEGQKCVIRLIKEEGIGVIYDLKTFKENLKNESVTNWLKDGKNNFSMLKALCSTEVLRVLMTTENIILSSSNELLKFDQVYSNMPSGITFISNRRINVVVKELLAENNVSLMFNPFNAFTFFEQNFTAIAALTKESHVTNIWNFIFEYWADLKSEDFVKASLSKLNIVCKSVKEVQPVMTVYLPRELAMQGHDVEVLIESIKLEQKYFLDHSKLQHGLSTWREIFRIAKVKSGIKDITEELINSIGTLKEDLHESALKHLFKFWRDNKGNVDLKLSDQQIEAISKFIKVKCNDGFRTPADSVIPAYYSGDKRITEIFPSLEIQAVISPDYSRDGRFNADWNVFFGLIGCNKLNDSQLIYKYKLALFVREQTKLTNIHFEFFKDLDTLILANQFQKENALQIAVSDCQGICLFSSKKSLLPAATKSYFSSDYQPKLDLQQDQSIIGKIEFISSGYFKNNISFSLLHDFFGVEGNFKFRTVSPGRFELNLGNLALLDNYNGLFWNYMIQSKENIQAFVASDLLNTIKTNASVPTINGLKKPAELYSVSLAAYVDTEFFPLIDLTKVKAEDSRTLEDIIGIKQKLPPGNCLALFKKAVPPALGIIKELDAIGIILAAPADEIDITGTKLPNADFEWYLTDQLFTTEDPEIFAQNADRHVHPDFKTIAAKLGVRKVSTSDLKLQCDFTEGSYVQSQIVNAFRTRSEFIAFLMIAEDGDIVKYIALAERIFRAINVFTFKECDAISYQYQLGNLIWSFPVQKVEENNTIYFTDEKIRDRFLFDFISSFGKINRKKFFNYLFTLQRDIDVIYNLSEEFEHLPEKWADLIKRKPDKTFEQEVLDFIQAELEDTEWGIYITEIKNILTLAISQPAERQILINLIAKVKLVKLLGAHFTSSGQVFNQLIVDCHKFFVHSARGAIAYIHPDEVLRMRDEGFQMAIDFSTSGRIRIFTSPEQLLNVNTNHLLLYQKEKSIRDLFDFCEHNRSANKHLLITDRDNAYDHSSNIVALLTPPDDYR